VVTADNAPMHNIKDYSLAELGDWMAAQGEKPFRARQVFQWLYQKGARDFAEMTNLSQALRERLAAHFHTGALGRAQELDSVDGSRKYLFRLADGREVESVLMPNNNHYTLCISTQVGCAMGCAFCTTASMGLVRNLSTGEITGQVTEASRDLPEGEFISNVVFMGMGEPLHNYDNVVRAIFVLTDDHAFRMSARRVTVSTSGLVPAIRRFAEREELYAHAEAVRVRQEAVAPPMPQAALNKEPS